MNVATDDIGDARARSSRLRFTRLTIEGAGEAGSRLQSGSDRSTDARSR